MSFFDEQTNTVFFSEALKTRYPNVFYPAKINLEANGIEVRLISGTENIWARDFMPVQVGDHYVKFKYKDWGYKRFKVDENCYKFLPNITYSDIILDGGNCQRFGDVSVISEILFKHNLRAKKDDLIKKLSDILESRIIIIPVEPGDDLGHADGAIKFINQHLVLMNNYAMMGNQKYVNHQENLVTILRKSGLREVLLTCAYKKAPKLTEQEFKIRYPEADDFNPGFGYYINFLLVRDVILFPVMNISEDFGAMRTVKALFPQYNIVAIDCADLSMEGGLMNCVTMNYKM